MNFHRWKKLKEILCGSDNTCTPKPPRFTEFGYPVSKRGGRRKRSGTIILVTVDALSTHPFRSYFDENKRQGLEIFPGTRFFEHTYWQLWRMTLEGGLWRPATASLPKGWPMPSPPTFAGTEHHTECSGRSLYSEPSDPCTSTSSKPVKKWQCFKKLWSELGATEKR